MRVRDVLFYILCVSECGDQHSDFEKMGPRRGEMKRDPNRLRGASSGFA